VDADAAASAAAAQHNVDATTIAALRQQVLDLQKEVDALKNPPPVDPPPPPPPTDSRLDFIIGTSTGPKALDTDEESERRYYNNTTIANMLADAEAQMKNGDVPFMSTKPYGKTTTNNWAQIAAGQGDSWIIPMLDKAEALAVKYGIPFYLAVHHEPDDEILSGWKTSDFVAMQMHIAQLSVARPHVKYGVITMGYHQWEKTDVPMSSVVPPQLAVLLDFVGFDPYDEKGTKDWPTYVAKVKNWVMNSGNSKLEFGVCETGTTAATFASHPDWFAKTVNAWKNAGAKFWIYWNSQVASSQTPNPNTDWRMNAAMVQAFNNLSDNI
jgi:hypothetical protein